MPKLSEIVETSVDNAAGEVFYVDRRMKRDWNDNREPDSNTYLVGWYYWCCFPGCLPEGQPIGPYKSRYAAYNACYDDWQLYAE